MSSCCLQQLALSRTRERPLGYGSGNSPSSTRYVGQNQGNRRTGRVCSPRRQMHEAIRRTTSTNPATSFIRTGAMRRRMARRHYLFTAQSADCQARADLCSPCPSGALGRAGPLTGTRAPSDPSQRRGVSEPLGDPLPDHGQCGGRKGLADRPIFGGTARCGRLEQVIESRHAHHAIIAIAPGLERAL